MRRAPKTLWLLAAGAALLGGCATYDDGYYDRYAYSDRYYSDRPYRYYDYGPTYYYGPRYHSEPSVSLGFGFSRGWYR